MNRKDDRYWLNQFILLADWEKTRSGHIARLVAERRMSLKEKISKTKEANGECVDLVSRLN
jgi:hypothetical protein